MRISEANEECQRAPNHQPPTSKRSETALRLNRDPSTEKFSKRFRLTARFEFRKVQREGRRLQGIFLIFQFIKQALPHPRLGITVSKQFGSAVMRNLLKRRVREVFRRGKDRLPPGLVLHVQPRPQMKMPTLQQVESDFKLLCDSLTPQLDSSPIKSSGAPFSFNR